MFKLKKGEEPEDKALTYAQITISPGDENSDIIWFSMDEWLSKPLTLDDWPNDTVRRMIQNKIPIWSEAARTHKADKSWWPVKYASIVAYFPEGKLGIYPGTLGTDIGDYEFERIWTNISRDLIEIGAWTTNYTGMMD